VEHKAIAMDRTAPRVRRAYYECRYGQLHLVNAIPAGGGFDERTSVLCVHGQSQTGNVFLPLLQALGQQRSLYAPDMPGQGQSDPAPGNVKPALAAALACGDFLDAMRIRSLDLVACGTGCTVARLLAAERSQAIRRVVLIDEVMVPAGLPRAPEPEPVSVLMLASQGADPAGLVERIATFLDA
jgi:pimeloyl-ACP methyl ester carboxylesterase